MQSGGKRHGEKGCSVRGVPPWGSDNSADTENEEEVTKCEGGRGRASGAADGRMRGPWEQCHRAGPHRHPETMRLARERCDRLGRCMDCILSVMGRREGVRSGIHDSRCPHSARQHAHKAPARWAKSGSEIPEDFVLPKVQPGRASTRLPALKMRRKETRLGICICVCALCT